MDAKIFIDVIFVLFFLPDLFPIDPPEYMPPGQNIFLYRLSPFIRGVIIIRYTDDFQAFSPV